MEYLEKVSYKVDKDNKIIDLSEDWKKAATDGNAQELADPKKVIGKSILSYVVGEATKMYYQVVFGKCRRLKKEHVISYRCDSPTHRRFMKMQINSGPADALHIDNYLLKEEPFSHRVTIIEKGSLDYKNPIRRCSICNSLKLPNSENWVTPEALATEEKKEYVVIHTICPTCENKDWHLKPRK